MDADTSLLLGGRDTLTGRVAAAVAVGVSLLPPLMIVLPREVIWTEGGGGYDCHTDAVTLLVYSYTLTTTITASTTLLTVVLVIIVCQLKRFKRLQQR